MASPSIISSSSSSKKAINSAAVAPLQIQADNTDESVIKGTNGSSAESSPESSPTSGGKILVRGRKSPREIEMNAVHEELEKLNIATDVINKLELQLDEARSAFAEIRSSWSQQLEKLSKKLGNCIDKSRPYYEAKLQARQIQDEAQKAALRFERANSMHAVAKQQVALTQESLNRQDPKVVDPACLEVLNHHIQRVNEAERERIQSEDEHRRISQKVEESSRRMSFLEKDLSRNIKKSKVYFDRRVEFTRVLEEQKALIERIEMEVKQKKKDYTTSLRNLEKISERIHARRRLGERGSGVGSESPGPPASDEPKALSVDTSLCGARNGPLSPLSPRALKAIDRLKTSQKSPKVHALLSTLGDEGESVRPERALSEPREDVRRFISAVDSAEKAGESPIQFVDGASSSVGSSRRPASYAGIQQHSGVLLIAQQLSEYDWFNEYQEKRGRAFSFPPEELDVQYRTAPEGVKQFPTPPRTPVDAQGLPASLSSGALDRLVQTAPQEKNPLSVIHSVFPPSSPAVEKARTLPQSAREEVEKPQGHQRQWSNWSSGTASSIGDSLSLSGLSDGGSSLGGVTDDETKLNRMLRSHTSLIQEIEEVADRAKLESQQLSGSSPNDSPRISAKPNPLPSFDRDSASGESCN